MAASAAEVWERASLVCKVKEPQAEELAFLREGQVLFTLLHLAACPEVADALLRSRVHRRWIRDGATRVPARCPSSRR